MIELIFGILSLAFVAYGFYLLIDIYNRDTDKYDRHKK